MVSVYKILLSLLFVFAFNAAYAESGGPFFSGVVPDAKCPTTVRVTSGDGWAQIRAKSGLSGRPLWRIPNGSQLGFCGATETDDRGTDWAWVSFRSNEDPWNHEGWVSSRIVSLVVPGSPTPVVIHEPAPHPVIVQGPPPEVASDDNFDPKGCIIKTTLDRKYTAHKGPDETSEVIEELQSGDNICAISINKSGWSQIHWRRGKGHDGYIKDLEVNSAATPY